MSAQNAWLVAYIFGMGLGFWFGRECYKPKKKGTK